MRYKKALALVVGIGTLFAGSAFAKKGMGGPIIPPVDQAKLQEFCKDAQPLFQREAQLSLETRSLKLQPNPNWDAILEKEQELAKIRVELMKKAHDKGLPLGRFGMWRKYCGW
jgi:zinc resistance-associated protein